MFSYRSGLCVYEEVFADGSYMASGWNSAGFTLSVMEDIPTRMNNNLFTEAQSFDLEIDGVSFSWDFDLLDYSAEEETLLGGCEATHAKVVLKSRVKPILATVHTLLDGGNIFERWIEVENTGDTTLNINVMSPMCVAIEVIQNYGNYMNGAPDASKIYSLGYFATVGHRHEGSFIWQSIPYGTHRFGGKYDFGRYRHPMFMLRTIFSAL